jgi:small conductance mechanosensitive channel
VIAPGVFRAILLLLLIVAAAALALRFTNIVVRQAELRIKAPESEFELDQRGRLITLLETAKNTVRVIILTIAALVALATVGIDIGPVLAAAGIAGLALSLGAQMLIKDFLSGLVILFEDQYRVGDTITVGSVSGEVEKITLRRTNIRDAQGRLYVVSNGDVRVVGNDTREWSRALFDVNLSNDADIHKAIKALEGAMVSAASDPEISDDLLDRPEILGWNHFNDGAVSVRLQARVKLRKQWEVSQVMRRHALDALRNAGVPINSNTPPH